MSFDKIKRPEQGVWRFRFLRRRESCGIPTLFRSSDYLISNTIFDSAYPRLILIMSNLCVGRGKLAEILHQYFGVS